ncbi:MAG: right-handed parallel beta-helix repeat-containing protein, partial [Maribacter sp.]|nr:right-handed parallel beta-helix repeat-containing protein [Maribacter sp.]
MKFAYPFILVMLLGLIGCEKPVTQLYVGTNAQTKELDAKVVVFNSIQAALDETIKIQKENEKSLVVIHILEGEYWLSSPLKISPEHGPLRIVGQGSDKTIVKGSKLIKLQWEKFDNHIWTAQLDANEDFDQLFVNGKQQVLARYPNYDELGGHWLGHASDAISKERVKTWENPQGALVHAMHSGEWGGFHYKASGVDEEGELILNGGHQNNRPSKMHEKYRMVENVFEELDNPGEWFLDENFKLFYWPLKDMELEDAKIEIVQQKHLLEIIGTEENPIQDISVQGIRFEHAQRTLMEEYEPLLRSDWTIYRGAAVFLEGTKDISIDNCEFANLGGNVIFVSNYNRGVAITNNHIHDSGASAISFVGNSSAVRSPSFQYGQYVALEEIDTLRGPKTNNYPSNSRVDNNLIYSIGRVEKQTAGVQIAMAMKITVSNNSIYDVPRA